MFEIVLLVQIMCCQGNCFDGREDRNCAQVKNSDVKLKEFDYLIVGSGLYGAVFAQNAKKVGKKVLLVEKRPHIGGNVYTEDIESIQVHTYGPHVFHTNNRRVWEYVNQFAEFNRYTHSAVANFHGEIYALPFNMFTFNKVWGTITPDEAASKIEEQKKAEGIVEPTNLEEQAVLLIGRDVYEKMVKGYTEKQWGRSCKDLPVSIIKRLPVRLTFDNNYFNALYQGIPIGGYTKMIERLLDGIEVRIGVDYLQNKAGLDKLADRVIYTGTIDSYFNYKLGELEYRTVRFETEVLEMPNFQGCAQINYVDLETPWTRITEHKWFEFGTQSKAQKKTVISREYSAEWKIGSEPYYPVNDEKNNRLYSAYRSLAMSQGKVVFGGRLGEYRYYDMDAVIQASLELVDKELSKELS